MKIDELKTAKFLLDKLVKEYPSIYDERGLVRDSWGDDAAMRKTSPTRVKEEIRLIRRLLLEVAKEL